MDYRRLGRTNWPVAPIGLGTVEIGLPYGIGKNSLPSDKEAERILKMAVDMGITYFDTARGYGVAEERIGKFGVAKLPGVIVGTKCAQFLEQGEDPRGQELEQKINREVEESLRNLRVESLQLLQLHGGTKEQIARGELIDIVRRLQEVGKVQQVGIATRGEEAPLAAIESGYFATLQTGFSILDQRMASAVLPRARQYNVGIINRSVLLKGALTPIVRKLPPELDLLKERSAQAAALAKNIGLDLPTLSFRFVLSQPAVSCALIGTVKPQHLQSAVAAAEAGPLPATIMARLESLAVNNSNQVDPAQWPR